MGLAAKTFNIELVKKINVTLRLIFINTQVIDVAHAISAVAVFQLAAESNASEIVYATSRLGAISALIRAVGSLARSGEELCAGIILRRIQEAFFPDAPENDEDLGLSAT